MAVAFGDSIESEFPRLAPLTSGAGHLLPMGAFLCISGCLAATLDTITRFQSVSRHGWTSPEVRGGLQTTPYMHLENRGPTGNRAGDTCHLDVVGSNSTVRSVSSQPSRWEWLSGAPSHSSVLMHPPWVKVCDMNKSMVPKACSIWAMEEKQDLKWMKPEATLQKVLPIWSVKKGFRFSSTLIKMKALMHKNYKCTEEGRFIYFCMQPVGITLT